jgi:hypothetical protein
MSLNPALVPTGSVVLLAYQTKKERFGNDMEANYRRMWAMRLNDNSLMAFESYKSDSDKLWVEVKGAMMALMDASLKSVELSDGSVLERDDDGSQM